ncbi:hypothetical protein ISN45_Aa02g027630 [Arabidopsis thaliana x Arabidopsis arenosa]|uniref:Uncharacterized protein n=1 Tax=Arabidopsis thaliana x Arabidopsis arenosa TaxID=1240361 RepID=A0A8T2BJK3_9BRAS|nr:hypothetical protein ISN45_Aa02g027630 [Arabidopsis thaliana x Arabidopsis arenosa]
MKIDVGGSAAVLGAAKAIGQIKPPGVEAAPKPPPAMYYITEGMKVGRCIFAIVTLSKRNLNIAPEAGYVTYSQASVSVFTCLFSVFFFHYLPSLSYFQKYKQALKSITSEVLFYFVYLLHYDYERH